VDNDGDNDVYVSSGLETKDGTVYTIYFGLQPFYFWNGKELNKGVHKCSRNIVCYLKFVGARV